MMPPGMDFGGDAPKPPQRPGNEPGQGNGQAGNENATAGEPGRDSGFYVLDADWDESEHPRGDDGKFRAGSGGGESKDHSIDHVEGEHADEIRNLYGKRYENLQGQAAIDKLVKEKNGYVPAAFHRDDIGDIDLVYGNEKVGLCHIIKRREEDGLETDDFLRILPDLISTGKKTDHLGRFNIEKDGSMAIITPTYFDQKITLLLTAFKKKK